LRITIGSRRVAFFFFATNARRRVTGIISFGRDSARDAPLAQLGICKNHRTNGGGRPPPLSSQSQLNTILRGPRGPVMAQKESKLKSPSWQNDRWYRPDVRRRESDRDRRKRETGEKERRGETGRGGWREESGETVFLPYPPMWESSSSPFRKKIHEKERKNTERSKSGADDSATTKPISLANIANPLHLLKMRIWSLHGAAVIYIDRNREKEMGRDGSSFSLL